ncbi:MAG: hypothetical protein AMS22_09785, partial [Thiotrichales bacterium SG8_50]
ATPSTAPVWHRRWRDRVLARYQNRPDSEVGQALVRLVVTGVLATYPTITILSGGHPEWWSWLPWAIFFAAFSTGILVWIGIDPGISHLRRVTAMVVDISMATFGLIVWGELASPLVLVYYWVTLAFGARYGARYLLGSMLLSIAGFSLVLVVSPFWQTLPVALGAGLLVGLGTIPLYILQLLNQLTRALKAAESANRAKSNFLATMSHEFRTPLQAIIGMIQLLLDTRLNEKQRNYGKTVVDAAENLVTLLNDILDITKIEAGKLALSPTDFDLHATINNTGALLGVTATSKGLRLLIHIDPNTPFLLHGDEQRLRQILINLVGNAIKFTDAGHIEIRVSLESTDNDIAWIAFSVSDTGAGIPKEAQAHIFERFEQVDRSITRTHGGTGLGLAISNDLVDAMGGKLSLSSEPDVGSTFSFSLPFNRQDIAEAMTPLKGNALVVSRDIRMIEQLDGWLTGWGLGLRTLDDISALSIADIIGAGDYTAVVVDEKSVSDVREFAYAVGRMDSASRQCVVLIRRGSLPATASLLEAGLPTALTLPLDKRQVFNSVHAAQADHRATTATGVVPLTRIVPPDTKKLSLSILVADDTFVNREIMAEVFRRAGHKVFLCNNGEEALDALTEHDFDLTIVDYHMPGLSGVEVVQAFRAMDPLGEKMPFILMTADATAQAQQVCRDVGFDLMLVKPVRPHQMLEAVDRIIDRKSSGAPFERRKSVREPTDSALDYALLASLPFDAETVNQYIDEFIKTTPALLNETEVLRREGKFDAVRDNVHKIHNIAGHLGAAELARACGMLENMSPSVLATEDGAGNVRRLRELFNRACDALMAYQRSSAN